MVLMSRNHWNHCWISRFCLFLSFLTSPYVDSISYLLGRTIPPQTSPHTATSNMKSILLPTSLQTTAKIVPWQKTLQPTPMKRGKTMKNGDSFKFRERKSAPKDDMPRMLKSAHSTNEVLWCWGIDIPLNEVRCDDVADVSLLPCALLEIGCVSPYPFMRLSWICRSRRLSSCVSSCYQSAFFLADCPATQ